MTSFRTALTAALFVAWLPAAQAQGPAAAGPHKPIYMYQGADRDQRVVEGARKEKQVVVYTSLNLKDSVPISQAFEKKYGVKVELWRSSSEKVLQRALTEARAGRFAVDAFELNGPELEALYREGLLEEFHSPQFKNLPPSAFPKHRHYAADRFNFFTIAYNTNLVKPDEVPTSYEDLAHPRWKGKIGIEASDTDWFGSIVKHMGEQKGLALFRKIAQQQPQIRTGHTLIAELVASGEIPLAATIYNHNAERLLVNGAPIKWKALNPTFGRPNAVAVAKRAQRPHAALLFVDFMLSLEGQELMKKRNRVPASPKVDTKLNDFPYEMIDPVIVLDEAEKWEKIWSELFLKGAAIQREKD
ncbi:MAG: ABC transporter substrate-binding protein [Betaproteobacteria bacterium RIFCSPLOWO2_12_FULL_65_14]|nr:MAG: ABC transporter substrate-binding protein [Betaproteobacteria bacterium RIFCSPLOWO2_12_FULL_65_14]